MKGTPEERFWSKVRRGEDNFCWFFTGRGRKDGDYGLFKVDGKRVAAHRFSWELANKTTIPPGMILLHICDNPPCVNPKHLKLGTRKENAQDMVAKGRNVVSIGTENFNSVLTEEDVIEIRKRVANGEIQAEIAREYKLSPTAIYSLVKRKTWKHLP